MKKRPNHPIMNVKRQVTIVMSATSTFLTVDSGGSKTTLTLFSSSNECIKETTVKGFGTATDSTEILTELQGILQHFCVGFTVQSVVCNLGGRNKTQFSATLQDTFPLATILVFRESEGAAGVELCRMHAAQVALLAGTGSIAIAPVLQNVVISGGWGANISDDGSGYAVGLAAVRSALQQVDGTAPLGTLAKRLTGLTEPPALLDASAYCDLRDAVRAHMGPFDRAHVASLAKTVYDCAQSGDETAIAILKKAGTDLANTVLTAASKANVTLQTVVVSGGMVHSKAIWQDEFEQTIRRVHPLQNVVYLPNGICDAMQTIAKNNMK